MPTVRTHITEEVMAVAYTLEARERNPNQIISQDPNTGQHIGSAPVCGPAEVEAAVARARAAQPAWAGLGLKGRTRVMRRVQEALVEHGEELAELVSQEVGKVLGEAYVGDVLLSVASLSTYLRLAPRVLRTRRVCHSLLHINKRTAIVQEPLGVVAVISPYNFPVLLPMQSTFAALIAGNSVVNKPSEHTPLTALRLAELFREAGLPENLFQVVTGYGETGQALANAGVDKISFVGSTEHGRRVAAAAAGQFLPLTLEMGGVNAMIVLDDAPLERAVDGALQWTCATSGQVCGSIARTYVHEAIADAFMARAAARARDWRVRPDRSLDNDLAALVSHAQRQKVREMVQEALASGARLLVDGTAPDGDEGAPLCGPTILTDMNQQMTLMQEESFGPVMSIVRFADDEEAIRLANDSPYGLTASVWSRDRRRAWRVASRLEVGSVAVNDHLWPFFAPEVPWGGIKNSGLGFVGGEWGLMSMVRPKVISHDRFIFKREFYWQPYEAWIFGFFRGAMRLLYSRKWGTRLKGLVEVLDSLLRR
jgi:succinate-semialdehyde dehydrogenase/glutarate-semialdehyde dehydrogenase